MHSSDICNIYTKNIHENFKTYYANWEPGEPKKLGDYGLLLRNQFYYIGNISQLGIKFKIKEDKSATHKTYSSRNTKIVYGDAGRSNKPGIPLRRKANVQINFGSENGIYFNASKCINNMIQNKVALGEIIIKKFEKNEWNENWVIITDIVKADATTLIISNSKDSAITLEARSKVPHINLADARIKLNVKTEKDVAYRVVSQDGLIPLIGLCKIEKEIISPDSFVPLYKKRWWIPREPIVRAEKSNLRCPPISKKKKIELLKKRGIESEQAQRMIEESELPEGTKLELEKEPEESDYYYFGQLV